MLLSETQEKKHTQIPGAKEFYKQLPGRTLNIEWLSEVAADIAI